jgi:hypothetical protein
MAEKPSVLIVGGMGYIGRFLALYIHENNLASDVRIVDKVLPQLAWLAPEFAEACSQSKFVQADACQSREQNSPRPAVNIQMANMERSQNRSRGYSIARTESSSTMSSIVRARRGTRRMTRYTSFAW